MNPELVNASELLDANVERGRAGRIALRHRERALTYADLLALTCRVGAGLAALGVRREDRVAMVMDDRPEFVATFLGAIRIGAVPVPVNPLLRSPDDYRYVLDDSLARAVVADAAFLPKVAAARRGAGEVRALVAVGEPGEGGDGADLTFADLVDGRPDHVDAAPTRHDDMAFWLYSSGSTGRPKAVVHLQHDMDVTARTYARTVLGVGEDDVTFSTTKLFHAYGLGNALTFPLTFGGSSLLLDGRPTPAAVLGTIAAFRPTLFFSVPTLYNLILASPEAATADLSSVRLCASAAEQLPADVWRRWKERFGVTILDGVGSTEMLHIYLSNRADDCVPGSTGVAVEGYRLRIVGEDGRDVGAGTAGTLLVAGDSALALYWAQHRKTVSSMLGEWFVTGDRYRQDESGHYWYEGRADDMIKVGGLWVSPVEVESTLIEHPAVAEGAVIGVVVDGLVRIKAYVVPAPDADGAGDELRAALQGWCKDRLQRYQYPHLIEFVDELPKTTTGKIQRYRLREESAGVESAGEEAMA